MGGDEHLRGETDGDLFSLRNSGFGGSGWVDVDPNEGGRGLSLMAAVKIWCGIDASWPVVLHTIPFCT